VHPDARRKTPNAFLFAAAVLVAAVAAVAGTAAQNRREFKISAHKYAFKIDGSDKLEIRVVQGDVVHVTFSADDIPHSFTVDDDHYRINKRAEPGKPVTFDFVADQLTPNGGCPVKCMLTADSRCRELAAVLIVEARK
jgi:heme/copper-type cytochrome/quinol oxidase subunit 2